MKSLRLMKENILSLMLTKLRIKRVTTKSFSPLLQPANGPGKILLIIHSKSSKAKSFLKTLPLVINLKKQFFTT